MTARYVSVDADLDASPPERISDGPYWQITAPRSTASWAVGLGIGLGLVATGGALVGLSLAMDGESTDDPDPSTRLTNGQLFRDVTRPATFALGAVIAAVGLIVSCVFVERSKAAGFEPTEIELEAAAPGYHSAFRTLTVPGNSRNVSLVLAPIRASSVTSSVSRDESSPGRWP